MLFLGARWGITIVALSLLVHCSGEDLTEIYGACSADADCDSGTCARNHTEIEDPYCTEKCDDDADCPGGGVCHPGYDFCVPSACSEPEDPGTPFACIDGELVHCDANSPCSQCDDVCPDDEYCTEDDTCVPKRAYGEPCEEYKECPGVCGDARDWDGNSKFGGQSFCLLEDGVPCESIDPCTCGPAGLCNLGWLCYGDEDCPVGTCESFSGISGSCELDCDGEGDDCGGSGICEDIGTVLASEFVCRGQGDLPPRPQGWPCTADEHCEGVCCPEVDGAGYQACSDADGGC